VQRVITADLAHWDGRGWVLTQGRAQTPIIGATPTPESPLAGQSVAIERLDTSLDPLRLQVRSLQGFGQNLSWRQISAMLAGGGLDPHARQRLERIRWSHLSTLACNLVTLFAALPFFLLRAPQPLLIPALKAAPIAMSGLVAAAIGSTVSLPGLPVWLSAFIPCLVLLPIAVALYTGVRS
jgi:hypothetical protein